MTEYVLRVLGAAGTVTLGEGPYEGFVERYDPERHGGRGFLKTTNDIAKAIKFADKGDAFAFWHQTSKTRPHRPDGKPNRPMTAFHVMIEPVEV